MRHDCGVGIDCRMKDLNGKSFLSEFDSELRKRVDGEYTLVVERLYLRARHWFVVLQSRDSHAGDFGRRWRRVRDRFALPRYASPLLSDCDVQLFVYGYSSTESISTKL